MPEQQVISTINWQTVGLALVTAIVTAWVTSWFNNRYEKERLMRMWRLQQSKDRLDSIKEHVHRYIEDIAVVSAVRNFANPTPDQRIAESEALVDSYRAAVSAASVSQSVGDAELSAAGQELQSTVGQILRGGPGHTALPTAAGALLRRCDELLAASDRAWWARFVRR
jgi:hypothetical protein